MTYTPRRWIGLGLGAALLGTTSLAACGGPTEPVHANAPKPAPAATPAAVSGEGGEGGGESGMAAMAHPDMQTLPVDKRIAFMSGHVAAGLALYRAGAPDQAARHLLHPVSETHAAERAGIDALGFDGPLFVKLSEDLAAGKSAEEVEPELAAADANIKLLQQNAASDPVGQIDFLMTTCINEYKVGVVDGAIVEAGEYQDAYGFAVVARDIAKRMDNPGAEQALMELELLVRMWPNNGPLADSIPAPVSEIAAQVSRVKLELSSLG
ncbi:hypothetical protein [Hyphomonas johnsonii]|jgi:hypothetical protein|uniref:Lipoprotein n=1 Tax=Hyphomonas johnsonii MHS-2 TaxID=1280950 RepID=A0A059FNA8_9PROT|nr:hypothetical protein [Hyphomonas johnsonii]KCZ92165.1 hypothetical protein HJO_09024 [Hyphomonas johnsonii MHS-2]